ncbi:diacylglycerol kinase theta [Gadus morhua]|uniref:diacylglycerol kinase theta n=1 Tax=Gadus morhua TaxID=8049 RepID=UPI0011B73305|nr:diacylglycerol kinase theta [Gadus morhua]
MLTSGYREGPPPPPHCDFLLTSREWCFASRATMAECGVADSPSASPVHGKKKAQQSPVCSSSRSRYQVGSPGHCFKRVTLTKPTFCHNCSDFIWGLVGFLCEVCNLMCHEKCLKNLRVTCSCMAPTLVQVPVAHCFGPAGLKKRFCCVCRKPTEGNASLRCEVCEMHVHADCSVFSCADCRLCHQDGTQTLDTFQHHWREGNLPTGARCEGCRRSCASSDVLAGMRCEWCGITSHAACYAVLPPACKLGRLASVLLPPSSVQLSSRNYSKMHCYRIAEGSHHDMDTLDEVGPSSPVAPRETPQTSSSESAKQAVRVFDGDDALKRGAFRLVSVPRVTRKEELVEAALRAFYLPDAPQRYELQALGTLQPLHSEDVLNRNGTLEHKKDAPPEAWVLRAVPLDTEVLKVHACWLKTGLSHTSISISRSSTVDSVLKELLVQLGRQEKDSSNFNLVEVHMGSKQVLRQVLTGEELLLDKLQEIRKVSLRQMNQTRFYATENRNHVIQVSLLIGGLPLLLPREEYTQLVQEHLSVKSHLVTISHMYGSQGAVVLQVSCFSEAERVYMLAKDTAVCGKQLTTLVIPHILHNKLARGACPMLVFVNPKSGGMKGRELLYNFRKLLNPHQVFDISNGGPLAGFHTFREVPRFRVLVCGGDGTVGWVLGVLEAIRHKLACSEPPMGIVPLGTGNDLARVLRWGPGYSGEDPHHILLSLEEADEVLMDRWTILLDAQDLSEDASQGDPDSGYLEPPKIVQMNNYFGLGIDAEVSLDFHQAREGDPDKFTSRFHNKGVYVKVGLQKLSHTRNLHKHLRLQVDKQEIELPNIEGLIFLNIPSWGSGADLWGSEGDSRFGRPRIDDGMLEVLGVTGVVHMGQVQSGLRSGIRIAQGNYIRITVTKPIPVQVDGEPWIQSSGHIIISAAGPKVRMLRKSKQKQKKSSGTKDARSESPSSREGGH